MPFEAADEPVVSVLAVDDHAASLEALRAVVAATSGFEVMAASCGAAVFLPKERVGRGTLASWARFGTRGHGSGRRGRPC
jgi:hypothetical protein